MSLAEYFHSVATGPKRRRNSLTPLGLLVFGSTLAVVIAGGLYTDRWLSLPPLLPGVIGTVADELIVSGPYARVRNPMLTGVFGALVGLGLLLHSPGLALIWTPAYALVHMAELKRVEEPELARRFGAVYEAYRARVPMFIPRLRRYQGRSVPRGEDRTGQ